MVNFGFSAFLKVLSLNPKPQRTAVLRRLGPSSGGGYDYHRSLRLHARRYLANGESMASVLASAAGITTDHERASAIAALERLEAWRLDTPGEIVNVNATIYESPHGLFSVRYEPAFGLKVAGQTTAFHIWNTKHPPLAPGPTFAALSLIDQAYDIEGKRPDDVAVLSLRGEPHTFALSDVADMSDLAEALVDRIEDIIDGGPSPSPNAPEDHPTH